uniref:Uncharacterized protein n=1 Tax=Monopterus albus TaxID=43700 RepID=A0A3Q3JR20_MONAL
MQLLNSAYLQAAAALTQKCGMWRNNEAPITKQGASGEFSYWTKPPSMTTVEPGEAVVSVGWLRHRDEKKCLPLEGRCAPSFKYKSRASHSAKASNDHDWGKQDLTMSEQRNQTSDSSGKQLISQQATKKAAAKLCWLAMEHHQLLADLLSLCEDCANKVRMGNWDGKLQDYILIGSHVLSSRNCPFSRSPEHKRAISKSKKMKQLGSRKLFGVEDFLPGKIKKTVRDGASYIELPVQNSVSACAAPVATQIPGTPTSVHVSDNPMAGSYVSEIANPVLPMEEPFQIACESLDFTVDNQNFDPDMDFYNDFSEYDGELGYQSSSCSLMEGLTRRESGSNLRPIKRFDSPTETLSETALAVKTAQDMYNEINQRYIGVRVVAKVQDVEGRVQHVGHTSSDRSGPTMPHPGTSSCQQGYGELISPNRDQLLGISGEKTSNKLSEGLQLPLFNTISPSPPARSHTKSPSSPSLAGVFNASFPSSNSLQSMSPVLSPLFSKQESPQLNHRIVLLSDNDVAPDRDSSSNTDEPRIFTEVINKNGNKRTVTRLDLNLSRWPSNSKWNSSGNSTTTEDSLLRQDDIWMLDGDDPREPLSRVPHPDHLDFLRITPPEDDLIGDTPYYPKLDCTTEVTSPADSEDRTPGRLQAVWPPPRSKNEEEKVGLKYTEAEHQAALFQLKRECKEELEKMHANYELKVFQLRGEHAGSVSKLEEIIANMQRDKSYNNTCKEHRAVRDAAVSNAADRARPD